MEKINVNDEVEGMEKSLNSLNLNNPNIKNEFNNFSKTEFIFNNTEFELGISLYSNLLFIIISSNSKLGSFYVGECENKDTLDPLENLYEIQCILGDRRDEATSFLSNSVITFVFNKMLQSEESHRFDKIEKVIVSTTIKFSDLIPSEEG